MLDVFTARSSLFSYAFVWAPHICMGKMLRISSDFSEASGPMLLKFHVEHPWSMRMNGCGPLTEMAAMPIYG